MKEKWNECSETTTKKPQKNTKGKKIRGKNYTRVKWKEYQTSFKKKPSVDGIIRNRKLGAQHDTTKHNEEKNERHLA